MNEKAIDAIQPRLTPEKIAEIRQAMIDAGRPFADQIAKLYAMASPGIIIHPDGSIESVDPYLSLPPGIQSMIDTLREQKAEIEKITARSYGLKVDERKSPN